MAKWIVRLIPALAAGVLCCAASLTAASEPVPGSGTGSDQGPVPDGAAIVFGFTPDARPLSWSEVILGNKTGHVLGFCRVLHDHLIALGRRVEARELPFDERFARFGRMLGGRPGIQCGPSSRTPARIAALRPTDDAGFTAEVTRPFLVTQSRLLIRRTRLPLLDEHPEALRIGLLKPRAGLEPVTTEVIEAVFPNAHFVGLSNRTEAVQRLTQAADAQDAIDAYASDDLMLRDILAHDIPDSLRADYALEPTLGGYSREEYVLVVYNAPELAAQVTQWLDSPNGRDAARALLPPTEPLPAALAWLARSDHLMETRQVLFVALALLGSAGAWLIWRRRRDHRASTADIQAAPVVRNEPAPPITGNDTATAGTPAARALTPREREILALIARGRSNKETARELGLSYRTVEAHRKNIYTKLGIKNTATLVEYALANRLL